MKILVTILIVFVLSCRVSLAQNVVISYGIPEPKSNDVSEVLDYISQMKNLERSFVSGLLKKTVKFSKESTPIDSVFKKLSDRFNAAVPENFFTPEGKYRLLTGEFGNQKNPRIQWDYAAIDDQGAVVIYAQLIVHFDSHKKNEIPAVRDIELQTENVTSLLTDEQIIQLYKKVKTITVELAPPPPITKP